MKHLHEILRYLFTAVKDYGALMIKMLGAFFIFQVLLQLWCVVFCWFCDKCSLAIPLTIVGLFAVPMWFIVKDSVKQILDESERAAAKKDNSNIHDRRGLQ